MECVAVCVCLVNRNTVLHMQSNHSSSNTIINRFNFCNIVLIYQNQMFDRKSSQQRDSNRIKRKWKKKANRVSFCEKEKGRDRHTHTYTLRESEKRGERERRALLYYLSGQFTGSNRSPSHRTESLIVKRTKIESLLFEHVSTERQKRQQRRHT